jgi:hypothetical protein
LLQNSLNDKPDVLAGPILRKVTPAAVTVWLALRKPCQVTLEVLDAGNTPILSGTRHTVAIGVNLHLVAVTAKPRPHSAGLTERIVYRYDVSFNFDGSVTSNPPKLQLATKNAKLAYPPFDLPSFALPPKDLNRLHLLQGSCRMPHGEGQDAMPMIDDLIAATAANADARPHQLLLTGDQIYADDVADALLPLLTDAGDMLLGWTEILPYPGQQTTAATALPPPCRRTLVLDKYAGLTSTDMQSHLMSLGEYLCMYLFVWSEVLWPQPPTLLSWQEIMKLAFSTPLSREEISRSKAAAGIIQQLVTNPIEGALARPPLKGIKVLPDRFQKHTTSVEEFAKTVWKVRRALANIPTYMIFDDHEVTDDWNTTRNWCRGVYDSPLGRRIVQNGLVSYALCQHWGNAPEQFESSLDPGSRLLQLLDTPQPTQLEAFKRKATEYNNKSASISSLLGVHAETELAKRTPYAVFHDPSSLQYHYTIEGTGHQVIVTDTRTWRSFPRGGANAPDFLSEDQFYEQILNENKIPGLAGRTLLVVLTTNAPAVQPIRAAARHAEMARTFAHYPDVYEAWEIPSVVFDRLLTTLTSKLPKDASGQFYGRAILLSGDVHHSFASRLVLRANTRFGDVRPSPGATAVFAQLVASSFKKEDEDTRGFQRKGYTYAPRLAHALAYIIPHTPQGEGYVGWIVPEGSRRDVGDKKSTDIKDVALNRISSDDIVLNQTKRPLPATTVALVEEFGPTRKVSWFEFNSVPDYRYRLDYLTISSSEHPPAQPPSIPPVSAGATLKQAAEAFKIANAHYLRVNGGLEGKQEIIGVNNFAEITFMGSGDNMKVKHTLRWRHPQALAGTWSTYEVSLNPNDPRIEEADFSFPGMPMVIKKP